MFIESDQMRPQLIKQIVQRHLEAYQSNIVQTLVKKEEYIMKLENALLPKRVHP